MAAVVLAACGSEDGAVTAADQGSAASSHGNHTSFSPPPAAPLRQDERFVSLSMPHAYTPKAPYGGTDEYRCFLVDPKLTANAYLTGSQFLPERPDLIHHAIFFKVDAEDVAQGHKLDAADPGDGWTCFGSSGIRSTAPRKEGGGNVSWVGVWARGSGEDVLTPGIGYELTSGDQIVMQLHYSLLDVPANVADQSSIRLRIADRQSGLSPVQTTLVAAPVELPCPADQSGPLCDRNASLADVSQRFRMSAESASDSLNMQCYGTKTPHPGPTQRCDGAFASSGMIHAVGGHMHMLGRGYKVELNPGTPKAQVLQEVTNFNFDNQKVSMLAKPVPVQKGDRYRVTCTHDMGLRRQLPSLRTLPPRYVVWGEGSADEMCIGILLWTR